MEKKRHILLLSRERKVRKYFKKEPMAETQTEVGGNAYTVLLSARRRNKIEKRVQRLSEKQLDRKKKKKRQYHKESNDAEP